MRKSLYVCLVSLAIGAMTSCVDSSYDLSNIDTNAEMKVNNLVVPVNLESIKLSSIINPDDNSIIKVVDGGYVALMEGNMKSDNIVIDPYDFSSNSVNPVTDDLDLIEYDPVIDTEVKFVGKYEFSHKPSSYDYSADDVPGEIVDVYHAEFESNFTYTVEIDGLDDIVSGYEIRDLKVQIPKGLEVDEANKQYYDKSTGIYHRDRIVIDGHSYTIKLGLTGADMKAAGMILDRNTHIVTFKGEVSVISGCVYIYSHNFKPGQVRLPSTVRYTGTPDIANFRVKKVDARIKYNFDDLSIDNIHIDNIPDLLADEETNIKIENPQIYLGINNPVEKYNVRAEAGLVMTPIRDGNPGEGITLDNGKIAIKSEGKNVYNYCIAPSRPEKFHEGFEGASFEPCSKLGELLAGSGIPEEIKVELTNPCIPEQDIIGFTLGEEINPLEGRYLLYAPLALTSGSRIAYGTTLDGWSSDDMDDISVSQLEISADVSCSIPVGVTLSLQPIDVDGNPISGVTISSVDIPLNASSVPVVMKATGKIERLDGVIIRAVSNEVAPTPLSPEQTITLDNLKIRVSGTYNTEL